MSADSRIVDLNLSAEVSRHLGNDEWGERKDADGGVVKAAMPRFSNHRVNTAITCVPGQINLVSVISPKEEPGRRWLVFVTCEVRAVKGGGE